MQVPTATVQNLGFCVPNGFLLFLFNLTGSVSDIIFRIFNFFIKNFFWSDFSSRSCTQFFIMTNLLSIFFPRFRMGRRFYNFFSPQICYFKIFVTVPHCKQMLFCWAFGNITSFQSAGAAFIVFMIIQRGILQYCISKGINLFILYAWT